MGEHNTEPKIPVAVERILAVDQEHLSGFVALAWRRPGGILREEAGVMTFRSHRLVTTFAWFAGCATAGWFVAPILYNLHVDCPLAGFFAAGVLAGSWLRAGWLAAVGCGIALAVGNGGGFLAVMQVQGMTGQETLLEVLPHTVMILVVSFGGGAALGLLGLLRRGVRSYVWATLGFGAGGLIGGLCVSGLIAAHAQQPGTLLLAPLVMASAVGGACTQHGLRIGGATDREPPETVDRPHPSAEGDNTGDEHSQPSGPGCRFPVAEMCAGIT